MTPSSSRGLISNSTKTIKKARPAPANQDSDTKAKKYKTFEDSKKQKILNDLWKGAIQILKLDPNQVSSDLLELLGGISLDQYNVLLRKTLTTHVDDFTYSVKALTQWRKKVKSWIQNQGKPETRGGLVVSVDRNELFRGRVIDILGKLPYRCFPTLQKSIIEVLEEFHNEAQDPANPKPFNPKTGSKHWWFNFIRKDADIKEMWEDLPLERTVKKNQRNSSSNSNSALMSDANSPVAEEEGNLNLNYTPVSGTVSTAGDSLEVSPQSLSPIRGESYQGLDLDNFYDGMEEEKIPESPSRYFAPQNNWREPESSFEFDEVVIDQFPEQTHSPNQEDVEEDIFYSFLNRRLD